MADLNRPEHIRGHVRDLRIIAGVFYALSMLFLLGGCVAGGRGLEALATIIGGVGGGIFFAILGASCSIVAAVHQARLPLVVNVEAAVAPQAPTPTPDPAPEVPKARLYTTPPWEKPR